MLAFFALAVTLALPLHGSGNAPAPVAQYFDPAFKGCFELLNLDEGRRLRSDSGNCAARVSPASTFKIPHALIALENGIVADETTPLRWNGTQYPIADWNRDQTLASAIRGSVVWYFQRIADQLGTAREQLGWTGWTTAIAMPAAA